MTFTTILNLSIFAIILIAIGLGIGTAVSAGQLRRMGDKDGCKAVKSQFYYSKASWISIAFCLVFSILSLVASFNENWKKKIDMYDRGEIKKVVTCNVKSIDGNEIKKDSTYTYKVVK